MSAISLSTSVNRHFLDKLMGLAEVGTIVASEDIVDVHGIRVLARGGRITAAQRQELSGRKLKKTIESCLSATGGVDTGALASSATRLLDTCVPLGRILQASGVKASTALAMLSTMRLGEPLRMLLTLADHDSEHALEHSVCVGLLAIGMANKLRLPEDEQRAAGLAGLLHDIGELYVDPTYLAPHKRLLPHEWAHLVIHPRLGQMLINELDAFPLAVGRAVAEHHERFDGTGYPRQMLGNHCSAAGQAVATAEMIAGVLGNDHPLERAELALKIVPGEHSRTLLSAVSSALRAQSRGHPIGQTDSAGAQDPQRLFRQIVAAIASGQALLDGAAAHAPATRALLARTLERIQTIERAFISTGLDACLKHEHGLADSADGSLVFEQTVATREIAWRLRDIARDLALHLPATAGERSAFSPLIALLDDDGAAPLRVASAPAVRRAA